MERFSWLAGPAYQLSLIVGLVLCAIWIRYVPTPGFAIGALGAVGVLVAIAADRVRGGHRVLWAAITVAFLVTEIRAIRKDRIEQDRIQRETIQTIVNGYQLQTTQNQRDFQATMSQFDSATEKLAGLAEQQGNVARLSRQNLYEQTGADSFIYIKPDQIFPLNNEMRANTHPVFVGKYPLHDVFVAVAGPMGWLPSISYGTVFPDEMGRPREAPALNWQSNADYPIVFNVFVNASTGSYSEQIEFKQIDGVWRQSISLHKYGKPKALYLYTDIPNQSRR
jgi:hypothetical protein